MVLDDPEALRCQDSYFAELQACLESRHDVGPGGAGGADGDADMPPPDGALLIARLIYRGVGCGGLGIRRPGDGSNFAEIKRMWVDDALRGLGMGQAILVAVEARARAHGEGLVRLDSNRCLNAAHTLYRRCGCEEIPHYNDNPYAHLWFQRWLD